MLNFLKSLLFGKRREDFGPPRFDLHSVARRLGMDLAELQAVRITYTPFDIPKRSSGVRTIHAPNSQLKQIQRRIHQRLLRRLPAHPNVTGFERGHSIVTNALPHAGKDFVIRLDLKDFFHSTSADRVNRYFRLIGYDQAAAQLLTSLCTYKGSLPQGAPTSPRLSNLVNYRLDARLAALATARGLSYSRYADDMTFSASQTDLKVATRNAEKSGPRHANDIIHAAKRIIQDEGYRLHTRRKLRIYRQHHRQLVTGLVVNNRPALPRSTRRRLRAIEHHLRTGRPASLTHEQFAGWKSLQEMIRTQTA